jgi:UDPglucose 6-dehydrogenase
MVCQGDFNINIVGVGFLGGSIANTLLKNKVKFNAYDITDYQNIKCHGRFNFFRCLSNLVVNSESNEFNDFNEYNTNVYFICVPTPSCENGECDTSIVKSVVKRLSELITRKSIIIVKSTVEPGTTRKLNEIYSNENLDIVFCPEFLREIRANEDMYNADFSLFGTNGNVDLNNSLKKLFKNVIYKHRKLNFFEKIFSKSIFKSHFGSFEEMELFKYTVNTFLATKVWYFNKIYEVCEGLNIDYQKFKTLFPLEERLGTSYGHQVPGYDGKFGAGGSCLIKDPLGMCALQKKLNISNIVLDEIMTENYIYREKIVRKK